MSNRGILVVLSGSSGSGKSTIIRALLKRRSDLVRNISTTTRAPRKYEQDGEHYHFVTRQQFQDGISAGRFLEWEEVHGQLYGTDKQFIASQTAQGRHILFDIDVKGGASLKRFYPDTILIFIYPPSVEELRRRLRLRGTEDHTGIERRISRYHFEKSKGDNYPYRIINDNLEITISEVLTIIDNQIKDRNKG